MKKGFTLVELLGVIVILAIIFVLISPSVTKILSQSRETVYQKQINTILSATYDFTLENLNYLPEDNSTNYVTLGQLKYEGLIDVNIKNSNIDEMFPDNLVISIKKVSTNYRTDDLSMLRGNYLYTIEMNKLDETSSLLPKIILSVEDGEGLIRSSDGNYTMRLNLNEEFPEINVSATQSESSSVDLTDQVKQYTLFNNDVVNKIDTSRPAIYKTNYSVVNRDGYATLVVLNIIIEDTIPPTITFPEETIISKNITHYDLLKDVSCQDNSGFCDIEYTDTIDYGTVNTYIIEYTVKDKLGNTRTSERVITIK